MKTWNKHGKQGFQTENKFAIHETNTPNVQSHIQVNRVFSFKPFSF